MPSKIYFPLFGSFLATLIHRMMNLSVNWSNGDRMLQRVEFLPIWYDLSNNPSLKIKVIKIVNPDFVNDQSVGLKYFRNKSSTDF